MPETNRVNEATRKLADTQGPRVHHTGPMKQMIGRAGDHLRQGSA
jgi:hypothetical protein